MNIPSSWQILPLQKVAKLQTGLTLNSKLKILCPVCVPYLRVANVQAGHIELGDLKTVVIESSTMQRFVLHPGDVLLTEGGDFDKLGRGAVWRGQISPCLHQNHVFAIRTDRLKLLPEFLSYQTESNYGRNYFLSCSKQSTNLVSINSTQIKNFPVIVPPLNEQRRIAEFLGTWDEAIEKLERLIAAKEKRFRGLIQMLISGKKGQWPIIRLGTLFSERNESNYPLGELLAITGECGVVRRCELDKVDSSSEDKSQYLRIHPGDIGYNTMRMWQGVCGVSRYDGIVSPAYTILVPDQNVNADFAVFYFKTPPVIHIFKRHSQGLVDDTLNLKYHHFSQIRLPFPELSEQNRIAEILTTAQNELNLLGKKLAALQKQKRGLMQKLLTGIWRI